MDLRKIIDIEFFIRNERSFCNENFGVINDMVPLLNETKEKNIEIMKNNRNFNGFVKIDHPVKNAFPKSLNICFTYHWMNCKSEVMSRYIGKDDNCANIVLEMNGKIVNLAGRIKSTLAHELTHAYEDDNRSLSKPGTSLLKTLDDLYTTSIIIKKNKNEFSHLVDCFADCCYWLNPAERRANLGRLENELSEYFVKIYDERSAEKYIKQIPLYNELMTIKSEYNEIVGQGNLIMQEIEDKINFDSGTFLTVKEMNKVIKQLGNFLDDFEEKLYRNAACIAYEEGTKYMETF